MTGDLLLLFTDCAAPIRDDCERRAATDMQQQWQGQWRWQWQWECLCSL